MPQIESRLSKKGNRTRLPSRMTSLYESLNSVSDHVVSLIQREDTQCLQREINLGRISVRLALFRCVMETRGNSVTPFMFDSLMAAGLLTNEFIERFTFFILCKVPDEETKGTISIFLFFWMELIRNFVLLLRIIRISSDLAPMVAPTFSILLARFKKCRWK